MQSYIEYGKALAGSVAARTRQERGQISAEMMGLLFIVALIIGAIVALGIHDDIANAIQGFIDNIKKGESPEQ